MTRSRINPSLNESNPSARIAKSITLGHADHGAFMRMVLFVAVVANSLDLVATALGIHHYNNREGNPLLAGIAHQHWWLFVLIKGIITPLLIARLYRYRNDSPVLATFGMGLVTVALTIAVGQWLCWIAAVETVSRFVHF
jgi:hypothetical protein